MTYLGISELQTWPNLCWLSTPAGGWGSDEVDILCHFFSTLWHSVIWFFHRNIITKDSPILLLCITSKNV
jgi:hypothetical protein